MSWELVRSGLLPGENRAHDLDVLAGARQRLAVGNAVPALDDLRARSADAQDEAAIGEVIQGHGRNGAGAAGYQHDGGTDFDRRRLREDPGSSRHRVVNKLT